MKRLLALTLAMVMVLAMFTGCAPKDPTVDPEKPVDKPGDDGKEKVLIVRASGDPQTFAPDWKSDDNAYPIMQNMFNRLTKLDASKNVIPDLAKSWDVSDDALTITFHLVENAKWHDGKPVTSEDVKFTFDTIKAEKTFYFNSKMDIVDSIEAPDPYTVVFNMNTADVSFISLLGWYGTFIAPKHIYDVEGVSWEDNEAAKKPVGSGPFMFSDYKQGQSTTIVANPDYHEAVPKLSKVVYTIIPDAATAVQALVNGEIDMLENVPASNVAELKANQAIRMDLNRYPSPMRIIPNFKEEKLADVAVRQAINLAINREEISEKCFMGIQKPEYNLYPSFVEWATNSEDSLPKFNIEAAIKTLEDAGYTKNDKGYYVDGITIDVFEGSGYPDAAKLIAATCKEAGIEIIVQVHEYNAWSDKVNTNRNFMLEMQGGFMGPDPSALKNRLFSDSGNNYGAYANPEFDKLILEGEQTGVQADRATAYKAAQKILADDVAYIPLVEFAGYDAAGSDVVNPPIDGTGKWGWAELTYTDIVAK